MAKERSDIGKDGNSHMNTKLRIAAVAASSALLVAAAPGVANAQDSSVSDLLGLPNLADLDLGSLSDIPVTGSDNLMNATAGSIKAPEGTDGQLNDALTGSIGTGQPKEDGNPIYGSLDNLGEATIGSSGEIVGSLTGTGEGTIGNTINGSLQGSVSPDTSSLGALNEAVIGSIENSTELTGSLTDPETSSLGAISEASVGSTEAVTGSIENGAELTGSLGDIDSSSLENLTGSSDALTGSLENSTEIFANLGGSSESLAGDGEEGGESGDGSSDAATGVLPLILIGGSVAAGVAVAANGGVQLPGLPPIVVPFELPFPIPGVVVATTTVTEAPA